MELYYDASEPAISFAAQDIKRVLNTKGTSVTMKALAELPSAPGSIYIVVALWKQIMDYAWDRGIEIYIITWNIRNDDIYNLRWGDPEYVKQFILHFPKNGRTAGYTFLIYVSPVMCYDM